MAALELVVVKVARKMRCLADKDRMKLAGSGSSADKERVKLAALVAANQLFPWIWPGQLRSSSLGEGSSPAAADGVFRVRAS